MIAGLKKLLNGMSGKQMMTDSESETSSTNSKDHITEVIKSLKEKLKECDSYIKYHTERLKNYEVESVALESTIKQLEKVK